MNKRIIGITLLVVGIALLLFGLNSSQTVGENVVEKTTGRYSSTTMWYIIGGIGAIVSGGAMLISCKSCRRD